MPSTVAAPPSGDMLRRYWWAVLLLFVGVAAWVALPSLKTQEQAALWAGAAPGRDQNLDSLERIETPEGSPGGPIFGKPTDDAAPAGNTKDAASPASDDARRAPSGLKVVAAAQSSGGTFASELQQLSRIGKRPDAALAAAGSATQAAAAPPAPAKAPFNPPRANFGEMRGLGGGGGRGTAASASAAPLAPFSTPGSKGPSLSLSSAKSAGAEGGSKVKQGTNQSLNELRGAENRLKAAAGGATAEMAAGQSNSIFDASGEKQSLLHGAGGAGALVGSMDGPAGNLKADFSAASKKVITPPGVPTRDLAYERELAKMQADQQMQTMIFQMLIGGIMGPMLGGGSTGMMGGMIGGGVVGSRIGGM
ncbi:MAG: hypothetical protein HY059_09910 [Proteobacteria bacterium]|nr:hypothetical protein [Pseudomonadota bacterium]